MSGTRQFFRIVTVFDAAFAISGLLLLGAAKARTYLELENEVRRLEEKQNRLVKENEKLINDINLLKSSSRIKQIAEEELGMRMAESDEIVRVQMRKSDK